MLSLEYHYLHDSMISSIIISNEATNIPLYVNTNTTLNETQLYIIHFIVFCFSVFFCFHLSK